MKVKWRLDRVETDKVNLVIGRICLEYGHSIGQLGGFVLWCEDDDVDVVIFGW